MWHHTMYTDEEKASPKNDSGLSHSSQSFHAQYLGELGKEHEQTPLERFSNGSFPMLPSLSCTSQEGQGYSSIRTVNPLNNVQHRIGTSPATNVPLSDKKYNYLSDTVVSGHLSQNLPTADRFSYSSATQEWQGYSNADNLAAASYLEVRDYVTSQESENYFPVLTVGPVAGSSSVPEQECLSQKEELSYDKYYAVSDEEYEKTLPSRLIALLDSVDSPFQNTATRANYLGTSGDVINSEFQNSPPVSSAEPVAGFSYASNSESGFFHNDELSRFNSLPVEGDIAPQRMDAERNLEDGFLKVTAVSSRHCQNSSISETPSYSSAPLVWKGYSNSGAKRYSEHRAFTQAGSSEESDMSSVPNMSFSEGTSIPVTNTYCRISSSFTRRDMETDINRSILPFVCGTYKRNANIESNIVQALTSEPVMSDISSLYTHEMGNTHDVIQKREKNDNESLTFPQQTHATKAHHLFRKPSRQASMPCMPGQSYIPADGSLTPPDATRKVSDGYYPNFDRSQQTRNGNSEFPDFEQHSNICHDERKQRKKYSKDSSDSCGKQLPSCSQPNVNNDRDKPFVCDICAKGFTEKWKLTRHTRIHTAEKPFTCDICGKLFILKGALTNHLTTHTEDKPFNCDVCNKRFSEKRILNCHLRYHTREKRFKCDVCSKSFAWKQGLINHSKTHTGEKPFNCDVCNKSFNQEVSLKRHMMIHTGEKPFHCDVCSKRFSEKHILKCHLRYHSREKRFKCDVCSKSFSRNQGLINHSRTHTGEKPFNCDVCNKSFNQGVNLKSHFMTHTGEKRFHCDVCNKRFRLKQSLTYHLRTHA